MTFSERHGLGRRQLQIESMDDGLRTGLWNAVYSSYGDDIYAPDPMPMMSKRVRIARGYDPDRRLLAFAQKLFTQAMQQPYDNFNPREVRLDKRKLLDIIKKWILERPLDRVYVVIAFLPSNYPSTKVNAVFQTKVNHILEREHAGYRFIGHKLTRIPADKETQTVEESPRLGEPFTPAAEHVRRQPKVMSHSEKLEALIVRDGLLCQGCGLRPQDPGLPAWKLKRLIEIDHKMPRADDGGHELDNRVLLCRECNRTKGDSMTLSGLQKHNRKHKLMLGEVGTSPTEPQ